MKDALIKQALICFSIFLVITIALVFSDKVHIGFFGYVATLVFGTLFTTIGVVIGDAFRRFTKPDLIWSSSSIETFKTKVFWLLGPQLIGWFIGYIAFGGFMKNVLGFHGLA